MLHCIAWYTYPCRGLNIPEDENLWDFLPLHQYNLGLHKHTCTHARYIHFFSCGVSNRFLVMVSSYGASRSNSLETPYTVGISGGVISPMHRPLFDKTQHLQETDNYAPGGIRTQNPSKRAVAHLRLTPRGHWVMSYLDRPHYKRKFIKRTIYTNFDFTLKCPHWSWVTSRKCPHRSWVTSRKCPHRSWVTSRKCPHRSWATSRIQ